MSFVSLIGQRYIELYPFGQGVEDDSRIVYYFRKDTGSRKKDYGAFIAAESVKKA